MKQVKLLWICILIWGLSSICWALSADEYFEQGLVFFKQRKLELAIESFEKVVALDPAHSKAYLEMGFAYRLLGDFQSARNAYLGALALDQNDASAHLRLGEIYMLLNDPEAAEAEFAAYRLLTTSSSN